MSDVLKHEYGFTLLELLVVIAIIGILAGLASLSSDYIRRERVASMTREVLSDLQRARSDGMVTSPTATHPVTGVVTNLIRGVGIRFESPASYTVFKFNDANDNWRYDGAPEEWIPRTRQVKSSIDLSINDGGALVDPSNNVVIFDRMGIPRSLNWAMTNIDIGVRHRDVVEIKCVAVTTNIIRQGVWYANTCQQQ